MPLCDLAGHGRAHGDGIERRQNLRLHGLESGLGVRAGGSAGRRGAHRQAVPHLRQRGPLPTRGGGRPGPARRLLQRGPPGPFRPGGTGSVRAWPTPDSRCSNRTRPISRSPAWPGSASTTGRPFAGPCRTVRGGRRARRARSTTIPAGPGHWCASPSASSRTCSTKPCGGWGGCKGQRGRSLPFRPRVSRAARPCWASDFLGATRVSRCASCAPETQVSHRECRTAPGFGVGPVGPEEEVQPEAQASGLLVRSVTLGEGTVHQVVESDVLDHVAHAGTQRKPHVSQ